MSNNNFTIPIHLTCTLSLLPITRLASSRQALRLLSNPYNILVECIDALVSIHQELKGTQTKYDSNDA